jgi:hypothetical protein
MFTKKMFNTFWIRFISSVVIGMGIIVVFVLIG